MDTFSQAIAVVSAICFGIFAVAIFLTVLSYLNRLIQGTSGKTLIAQDFIKKDSLVTVKLSGGEMIERVKFIGFTKTQTNAKDGMPFPFARMGVFENEARERIFIPSATIKFIKEGPIETGLSSKSGI